MYKIIRNLRIALATLFKSKNTYGILFKKFNCAAHLGKYLLKVFQTLYCVELPSHRTPQCIFLCYKSHHADDTGIF